MMYSNTLSDNSSSGELNFSFLGAAQFFLNATWLVLGRYCLWLVQWSLQSDFWWFKPLPSETLSTIYSRYSPIFPFLYFFFRAFFCNFEFLYFSSDLISNCSLTLSIYDISGVLPSFSNMSPKNWTNFSISGIWPTCSIPPSTFLKKLFWSFLKLALSIIRLPLSMSFWSLIFSYLILSIQLSFYYFNILIVRFTPPISLMVPTLWLSLSFFGFFNKPHCWLLLSVV